ncbi:MAG: YybH family protein [Flavobacteriales bacterium]
MPNSVAWNSAEDAAEITALMDSQQQAWNRGDLSEFMQPYWQNDSLQFIGSSGLTHGWQRTLSNYQKSYPDKEAMGRLQFTNLSTDVLDSTHAHIIGKWQLFRSADTLAGHYTLLWKKMKGQWVIVADHSS